MILTLTFLILLSSCQWRWHMWTGHCPDQKLVAKNYCHISSNMLQKTVPDSAAYHGNCTQWDLELWLSATVYYIAFVWVSELNITGFGYLKLSKKPTPEQKTSWWAQVCLLTSTSRYQPAVAESDCVCLLTEGRVIEFPVIKIAEKDIVDTNGAGDAFVGGKWIRVSVEHYMCRQCHFSLDSLSKNTFQR